MININCNCFTEVLDISQIEVLSIKILQERFNSARQILKKSGSNKEEKHQKLLLQAYEYMKNESENLSLKEHDCNEFSEVSKQIFTEKYLKEDLRTAEMSAGNSDKVNDPAKEPLCKIISHKTSKGVLKFQIVRHGQNNTNDITTQEVLKEPKALREYLYGLSNVSSRKYAHLRNQYPTLFECLNN